MPLFMLALFSAFVRWLRFPRVRALRFSQFRWCKWVPTDSSELCVFLRYAWVPVQHPKASIICKSNQAWRTQTGWGIAGAELNNLWLWLSLFEQKHILKWFGFPVQGSRSALGIQRHDNQTHWTLGLGVGTGYGVCDVDVPLADQGIHFLFELGGGRGVEDFVKRLHVPESASARARRQGTSVLDHPEKRQTLKLEYA